MKQLILILMFLVSTEVKARDFEKHLETIIGYSIDQNGIVFQVYDGGCTRAEDFDIQVEKSTGKKTDITLYRHKFDPCKAFFPYGRKIRFSFDAMGINKNEAFKIRNPINPGFIRY